MHTVEWFQVLLSNSYNSFQHYSFVCTVILFQILLCNTNNSIQHESFVFPPLNGFKYGKELNISILSIDRTPTTIKSLAQRGPGIKGSERVLFIPQFVPVTMKLRKCIDVFFNDLSSVAVDFLMVSEIDFHFWPCPMISFVNDWVWFGMV